MAIEMGWEKHDTCPLWWWWWWWWWMMIHDSWFMMLIYDDLASLLFTSVLQRTPHQTSASHQDTALQKHCCKHKPTDWHCRPENWGSSMEGNTLPKFNGWNLNMIYLGGWLLNPMEKKYANVKMGENLPQIIGGENKRYLKFSPPSDGFQVRSFSFSRGLKNLRFRLADLREGNIRFSNLDWSRQSNPFQEKKRTTILPNKVSSSPPTKKETFPKIYSSSND